MSCVGIYTEQGKYYSYAVETTARYCPQEKGKPKGVPEAYWVGRGCPQRCRYGTAHAVERVSRHADRWLW